MVHKNVLNRTKKNQPPIKFVYNSEDYGSKDGMLTTVWGPGIWHYLHTMSFNYPVHPTESQKQHYRNFVLELQHVLPCGKCRDNLKKNLEKMPITTETMESRDTFSRYIYELHEMVNEMLGKKSGLTYEMVRERYEHFRARCARPEKTRRQQMKKGKGGRPRTKTLEKGCTEPLYGKKAKCVLKIVPIDTKCETLKVDKRCIRRKM